MHCLLDLSWCRDTKDEGSSELRDNHIHIHLLPVSQDISRRGPFFFLGVSLDSNTQLISRDLLTKNNLFFTDTSTKLTVLTS